MNELPDALKPLAAYSQFVIQELILRGDHIDKVPVDPATMRNTNAMDSSAWMTADKALSFSQALGPTYAIGFVLTKDDPFIFIDIDDCLQPDNTWSGIAHE